MINLGYETVFLCSGVYKTFWLPQKKYFDRVLSTDRAIRGHPLKPYPCRIAFPGRFTGSLLDMPDWNLDASDTGVLISFCLQKSPKKELYGVTG